MVLSDIGAENMHYGGDLTRTFPVGRTFTTRQKELYEVVLAMDHAISMLKPGVRYKDIHLAACQKLVEGLKQVNLMKGDPAEAVAAGAHTMFFQCGLGHIAGYGHEITLKAMGFAHRHSAVRIATRSGSPLPERTLHLPGQ